MSDQGVIAVLRYLLRVLVLGILLGIALFAVYVASAMLRS